MGFLIKNVQLEGCLLLFEFPIRFTNEAVALPDTFCGRLFSVYMLSVNIPAI